MLYLVWLGLRFIYLWVNLIRYTKVHIDKRSVENISRFKSNEVWWEHPSGPVAGWRRTCWRYQRNALNNIIAALLSSDWDQPLPAVRQGLCQGRDLNLGRWRTWDGEMIHDMLADEVDGNPVNNKSELRVRRWPQWTYLLSGPLGMITSANFFTKSSE